MGIFFSDNEVFCTKCGSNTFTKQQILYVEREKDKNIEHVIQEYYVCTKCGEKQKCKV